MSKPKEPGRGQAHHPAPPADVTELHAFPVRTVEGAWFRAHVDRGGGDHGCWWFSSVGGDPDEAGRFDLPTPGGTCYFASTQEAAARERVGTQLRNIGGTQSVTAAVLTTPTGPVVVTQTQLQPVRAANLPVKAAQRWVDRSLSVGTGIYSVSQSWAAAFCKIGLEAIVYSPRFTGGARVRALALFGVQGRPSPVPAVIGSEPIANVLRKARVRVAEPPATAPEVLPATTPPPPL